MYSGMLDAIGKIVRAEGAAGLYKGLVPNLVGIVPEKVRHPHVLDSYFRPQL